MIHLIQGRKRLLFFPKSLVNSIVRWIAGVHSPSGTIKIGNTMDPSDDSSISLDVNMGVVSNEVLKKIDTRPVTHEECKRLKQHLRGMVDGSSVQMSDGHISVNGEWVDNRIRELGEQAEDTNSIEAPQNPTTLISGYSGSPRAATDTFTASTAPNATGARIYLFTASVANGTDAALCLRPFTIAPDGRIYSIGAEDDTQAIDVVQSSTS